MVFLYIFFINKGNFLTIISQNLFFNNFQFHGIIALLQLCTFYGGDVMNISSFKKTVRHFPRLVFPFFLILVVLCGFLLTGCGQGNIPMSSSNSSSNKGDREIRDNTPLVLIPEASGVKVFESDLYSIDASNTSRGYVMVNYRGTSEKVKLQITIPSGLAYTYLVTTYNQWVTYPLSGGNGNYKIELFEVADLANDLYAVIFTQELDVVIEDEFLPFLYPNNYVYFTPDSAAVAKGKTLAEGATSDLEVITSIYNFVTKNIGYDVEKAQSVEYGYVPNVDSTLTTQKGICFDYASLMSAMLRSQGIPTRLEVGYAGEVYHAWISCYVDEIGWIDKIIQFDGVSWTLMDPTFAAGGGGSEYIGDGTNYQMKYNY
jgi:hypothetical protein